MVDYINKYKIKDKGLKLEKIEPKEAIEYYKELLTQNTSLMIFGHTED